ncbi:MAG: hypothetical protein M1839_008051 [Geoglossum umbratile]|nr:MAG: hypothetical protein M1839_008051 [Geoglossum umbratile]
MHAIEQVRELPIPQSERPSWSRQLRARPWPPQSETPPSEGLSPQPPPPRARQATFRTTYKFAIHQPHYSDRCKAGLMTAARMAPGDSVAAEIAKILRQRETEEFRRIQERLARSIGAPSNSDSGATAGRDQVRRARRRARQNSSPLPARLVSRPGRGDSGDANRIAKEAGRYAVRGTFDPPRSPLRSPRRSLADRANVASPAALEVTPLEHHLSILWGYIVFWHTYFQFRLYSFFHAMWQRATQWIWVWGSMGLLVIVVWAALEIRDLVTVWSGG